jgi:hypothetical protein
VFDHGAVAEAGQGDRAQADLGQAGHARVAHAEVQEVGLHDEVPDQQRHGVRGDEPAQEPQAHSVHGGVGGEPDRADPLAADDERDRQP